MKKIIVAFIIVSTLLLAGCGEKEKNDLEEAIIKESSGGWVLEKIEHSLPEDHKTASKISSFLAQAQATDTSVSVNYAAAGTDTSQKGLMHASVSGLKERFDAGEDVRLTVKGQGAFSADHHLDIYDEGRIAKGYIISDRDDVMNPYAQLYTPILWYKNTSESNEIPLKMPENTQGGDTVKLILGLDEVPHPNGAPSVTYTYKWME